MIEFNVAFTLSHVALYVTTITDKDVGRWALGALY